MNIKPILFFVFFFAIIIFAYYYYDLFTKYVPIHYFAQIIIVLITIFTLFFPDILKKIKQGDDMDDIKSYVIQKYKKKHQAESDSDITL